MDERMERWLVTTFDDAAAQVPLPPHATWLPRRRSRPDRAPWMAFAAAGLLLVVVALAGVLANAERLPVAAPSKTGSPIPLVPGISESETWGKVWSVSAGATVLRPTWLPFENTTTSYSVHTGAGLQRYVVAYYPREPVPPGPRPFLALFIAEGPDVLPAQVAPGESSENIVLRGQSGRLITAVDGAKRVVWTESGIRYTIQLDAGVPGDSIFRIASSLAPVVNAQGDTR